MSSQNIIVFPSAEPAPRDDKPHKCDQCEKSFKYPYLLRNHKETHTRKRTIVQVDPNQSGTSSRTRIRTSSAAEDVADPSVGENNRRILPAINPAAAANDDEDVDATLTEEELQQGEENQMFEWNLNENEDEEEVQTSNSSSLYPEITRILDQASDNHFDPEQAAANTLIDIQDDYHPFKNVASLILLSYLYGDEKMVSVSELNKLMYMINLLFKAQQQSVTDKCTFVLPKVDHLLKFQTRKSNDIPTFKTKIETKRVIIDNKETDASFGVNTITEHLKLLNANPTQSKKISALTDFTPDQAVSLPQGTAWRTKRLCQQPEMTIGSRHIWVGNVFEKKILAVSNDEVESNAGAVEDEEIDIEEVEADEEDEEDEDESIKCGLIHSFVTRNGATFVRYKNLEFNPIEYKVDEELVYIEVDKFDCEFGESVPRFVFDDKEPHPSTTKESSELLLNEHPMKEKKPNSQEYYKVKISPILLYSDDTSGNKSKAYNLYDSWSFTCAALPYEERNERRRIHMVAVVQGSKGLTAPTVSEQIVQDLEKLEKGVLMYSAEHNEIVKVFAPLLCFTGDNARQADICCLAKLSSKHPCKRCYYEKPRRNNANYFVNVRRRYNRRTRDHYVRASKLDTDRKGRLVGVNGGNFEAKTLSYKHTGAEPFLRLESFDPSLDCPVEILHTIPLGIGKFLVMYLFKKILHTVEAKPRLERLREKIKEHGGSKAYNRSFRRKLEHSGSYIGRDFKVLLQILPSILWEFNEPGDEKVKQIAKPIEKLGILSSLLFVRSISSNLNDYISVVDKAVKELIDALIEYDEIEGTKFAATPKVHNLLHITEDILRFGAPLHYETERQEQYNKYIREFVFHTNLHNTSVDVITKFGRQAMFTHIMDGGYWVNDDNNIVCRGNKVKTFLEKNDEITQQLLGFGDDQETKKTKKTSISDNLFAVFSVIDDTEQKKYFVGKAVEHDKKFRVIQYDYIDQDPSGNILTNETTTEYEGTACTVECILDMHRSTSNNERVLNICKYNTFWFLLQNSICNSDGSMNYLVDRSYITTPVDFYTS